MAELLKFVVAVDEWIAHHSNRNDLDSTDQFICCPSYSSGAWTAWKYQPFIFHLVKFLVILFRFSEIRCVYVIMINYDHECISTYSRHCPILWLFCRQLKQQLYLFISCAPRQQRGLSFVFWEIPGATFGSELHSLDMRLGWLKVFSNVLFSLFLLLFHVLIVFNCDFPRWCWFVLVVLKGVHVFVLDEPTLSFDVKSSCSLLGCSTGLTSVPSWVKHILGVSPI